MLKRIFFILFTVLLSFTSFSSVFAQGEAGQGISGNSGTAEEQKMIAPDSAIIPPYPRPDGQVPFSGQNHFYSLVFRGNGESIVTLRVALTNTDEKNELKEVTLRIPNVDEPKDLSVYQIILQPRCIRYEDRVSQVYPYTQRCAEYGEPPYYDSYWGYDGSAKYQKADFDFSGDTLKLRLPTPIGPNKTGSYFVYFRTFSYADKILFGAYGYEFESFKVDDQINELKVGISTDSDQFLKGAQGEVDYAREASAALKAMPAGDAGAVTNSTFDRYVVQIGYGQINKNVSNLAELESYKVEGMYADSRAKLYGREILTTLGIVLVLITFAVLAIRWLLRRTKGVKSDTKTVDKKEMKDGTRSFLLSGGVSFASALLTAGYTLGIYAAGNLINDIVGYQYQAIVALLLIVISFAVYLLLLVGPSVYLGIKEGWGWGVGTFVMTIVWITLFSIVAVVILFVFGNDPIYPGPIPLMRGAADTPVMLENK